MHHFTNTWVLKKALSQCIRHFLFRECKRVKKERPVDTIVVALLKNRPGDLYKAYQAVIRLDFRVLNIHADPAGFTQRKYLKEFIKSCFRVDKHYIFMTVVADFWKFLFYCGKSRIWEGWFW